MTIKYNKQNKTVKMELNKTNKQKRKRAQDKEQTSEIPSFTHSGIP